MKMSLTKSEQKTLKGIEGGKWRSIGEKERRRFESLARRQVKLARVNIRLSAEVLERLRRDAEETGIPYQTLISSVLNRYAHGRLHDEKSLLEAVRILQKVA